MSFANQKNVLLNDSFGNLYNFRWDQDKILYTNFNREIEKFDIYTLVDNATLEFDGAIDIKDNIYLVYQQKDHKMVLMTLSNGSWTNSFLGGENISSVYNLNIMVHHDRINIFYCTPLNKEKNNYRIYHHYYDNEKWNTLQLGDVRRKNLLNPFQFIKNEENIMIGFYDVINGEEQIFIKEFDSKIGQWQEAVCLTSSPRGKLYLDMLMTDHETLHLTYSEYIEGNLVIKYEKFKISRNDAVKILESTLSNPSNCTYPTFVADNDKLWNIWTEYDRVYSSFTADGGLSWRLPYSWKKSKEKLFFRYKFDTNVKSVKDRYGMNYTFGKDHPEFSFIGFGSLEHAVQVPLKEKIIKKKEVEKIVKSDGTNFKSEKITQDEMSKEDLKKIDDRMKELEERIGNIEAYINRRRRGILFNSKK